MATHLIGCERVKVEMKGYNYTLSIKVKLKVSTEILEVLTSILQLKTSDLIEGI